MPDRAIDYIVKMYKTLLSKGFTIKDIMVVVAQNKGKYGTQVLNNQIQNAVNPNTKEKIVSGETEYRLGDPIIQCVNDYKAQKYLQETDNVFEESDTFVPNGDIGVITEIKYNGIVVDFDENRIFIPKDKFQNIKLAYSVSCFKSQGGQARIVIAFAPNAHTFMLNSNLLYVAVTRARERCYLISDYVTYTRAIKKKENYARQTWLANLLQEE